MNKLLIYNKFLKNDYIYFKIKYLIQNLFLILINLLSFFLFFKLKDAKGCYRCPWFKNECKVIIRINNIFNS